MKSTLAHTLIFAGLMAAADTAHGQSTRANVAVVLRVDGLVAPDSAAFVGIVRRAIEAEPTLRYVVRPPTLDALTGRVATAHFIIFTGILASDAHTTIAIRAVNVEIGSILARDSIRTTPALVVDSLSAAAVRIAKLIAGARRQ